MFRRQRALKGSRSLFGNKDRKKLLQDLGRQFRLEDVGASFETLFAANGKIEKLKLQGEKVTVYFVDDEPILVETVDSSSGTPYFFPTVYAMWRFPSLVPTYAIHATTSTFLLGGADLMLAGVVVGNDGLSAFGRGDVCAVRVVGNRFPFAVGRSEIDSASAIRPGKKRGKATVVLHVFGDSLWELGSKTAPTAPQETVSTFSRSIICSPPEPHEDCEMDDLTYVPPGIVAESDIATQTNNGEPKENEDVDDENFPTLESSTPTASNASEGKESRSRQQAAAKQSKKKPSRVTQAAAEAAELQAKVFNASSAVVPLTAADSRDEVSGMSDLSPSPCPPRATDTQLVPPTSDGGPAGRSDREITLPPAATEVVIEWCLLEALRVYVRPEDFPMEAAVLFGKLRPLVPDIQRRVALLEALNEMGVDQELLRAAKNLQGTVVTAINKTSWKKLKKCIQVFAKRGWFTFKEIGSAKTLMIMSIAPDHKDIVSYIPMTKAELKRPKVAVDAAPSSSSEGGTHLQLQDLLLPAPLARPIFVAAGVEFGPGHYITPQHCRSALDHYLRQSLQCEEGYQERRRSGGDLVPLDKTLCLIVLTKDERKATVQELRLDELYRRWNEKAVEHYHCLLDTGVDPNICPPRVIKGRPQPIKISMETRMGKRQVTIVDGYQTFAIEPNQLIHGLAKLTASSVSLCDIPGSKSEGVLIQGTFPDVVSEFLQTTFAIPKKYIEVESKRKPAKSKT